MIGDREYLIFPAADSDLAAVDPNNRATDLNLFRELFMTLYDTQIALSCKNLQVILPGQFIFHLAERLFATGSNPVGSTFIYPFENAKKPKVFITDL
jgi:hypothetical protein